MRPFFVASRPLQVLDRSLLNVGGSSWWLNLLGRLKVQQLHARHARVGAALADLDNYALAATTVVRAGRDTSLRATMQADSLAAPPGACSSSASAGGGSATRGAPLGAALGRVSATATVRRKLPEHEVSAVVAFNERCLDGTSQYVATPFKVICRA